MAIPQNVKTYNVTIANGTSLSAQIDIGPNNLVGIGMPAGWDTAALTAKVSFDGGATWFDFWQGNVTPSSYLPVDHLQWSGVLSLKLQSGTTASTTNQTADRVFTLVTRPLTN